MLPIVLPLIAMIALESSLGQGEFWTPDRRLASSAKRLQRVYRIEQELERALASFQALAELVQIVHTRPYENDPEHR